VLTGILVQDTAGTESIEAVSPDLVDDQARCLLEDMPVHAMKVGPLYTTESVSVLAQITADYSHVPLVVQLQRIPNVSLEDEFDAEETQAALLELVLPQTDLVVADHALLLQWQSHGLLPGTSLEQAVASVLEFGASALLVSGVPSGGSQRFYFYRDENGQTSQFAAQATETVLGTDSLMATAIAAELARGSEVPVAVDYGLACINAMNGRSFQPGMGAKIFNRSHR
jgi:Hydroxymethylpyrimidine/phosphomethylpyrimidine kinase